MRDRERDGQSKPRAPGHRWALNHSPCPVEMRQGHKSSLHPASSPTSLVGLPFAQGPSWAPGQPLDALGPLGSWIYLGINDLQANLGPSTPDRTGLTQTQGRLCLHSTSISTAPITYLPHPLILGKKTHQNNYFMSPNMQIIFFNERCLTSPIQLICKCRRGFICDILSG